MGAFKQFEEMEVWKESRKIAHSIYVITIDHKFNQDPKLRWQMRGSSGSIMDNIAEGFARGGTNEFIQFLRIAKGSAGELQSQIYRCRDRNWLDKEQFDSLFNSTVAISSKIQKLIQYLIKTSRKGPTHK